MNLIEKLKDNKTGWMFLSEEEQKCIRQANEKGMVENLKFEGEWEGNSDGYNLSKTIVGANEIFRIKPDYQPDPEYVDLEITEIHITNKGFRLGVEIDGVPIQLHEIPSLPNFEGFYEPDDNKYEVILVWVARKISKDHKVYARFRKGGDA